MLWEEVVNRVTERQEQKSNPEFQREYRNRIRETHDQLNLYLPKDAKRMLIEITKVDWPPESPDNQYHLNK
ncbi:IncL/M type plasmid replication protein RepC [Enterobacter hormaechei subsp. oharae]|nr:IncL/M type plasmid replication protein RepC [Enterobacter hormaechei subsp. oharae]